MALDHARDAGSNRVYARRRRHAADRIGGGIRAMVDDRLADVVSRYGERRQVIECGDAQDRDRGGQNERPKGANQRFACHVRLPADLVPRQANHQSPIRELDFHAIDLVE